MKVLFLTNVPSPYRVKFFNKLGKLCDLTVLYQKKSSSERDVKWTAEIGKHYRSVFMKGISTGVDNAFCPEVINYLLFEKYDRIVICGIASPTEVLAITICKVFGISHYLEGDGGFVKKGHWMKERVKRFLITGADGYFSTCKAFDEYYRYYGADDGKIMRYPFTSLEEQDILKEPVSQEEKLYLRSELGMIEKRIVLCVGRYVHIKGLDVLLNASLELEKDIGVYFVGEEPTDECREFTKKRDLTQVHFVGFQSKEELSKYYRAADVFVLPTRGDVWGLVINEAMANGLPVITTDRCNAGLELISDGKEGYIVPADNSGSIADCINLFFKNDIERMQKDSIAKIRAYTIENMTAVHMEFLVKN